VAAIDRVDWRVDDDDARPMTMRDPGGPFDRFLAWIGSDRPLSGCVLTVLLVTALSIVPVVITLLLGQMHNVPFILAFYGAGLGLVMALWAVVSEHLRGTGDAQSWWGVIVFPMLGLLSHATGARQLGAYRGVCTRHNPSAVPAGCWLRSLTPYLTP
jgi:hypothetical protein